MSHEALERLHENLLRLKLGTAEEVLDSTLEMAANKQLATVDVLDHLIAEELRARRTSAIETNTKLAHFPVRKRLEDFDIGFQPSIDKAVFDDLRTLRFVAEAENVILLGPPGVGKTHIAIGLAMEAIKAGYSAYYISTPLLVERLRTAEERGKLDRTLKKLASYRLLIIDEIGYLPLERQESHLFFQLVARRYEKNSTVFTSNKAYSEWGEVLGDNVIASAILDRILHHGITLNIRGESYRMKARRAAGAAFPPPARTGSR
ncbi:MAG: IS21-like element helper ATPase IstB [Euryarchaeota archaeon]|nr:IS21-like element helper ATPase IstB [Euryarchaeota archaeon]